MVIFDKATYDRLIKEVPSYRLVTPAVVSERLKVNGSLARRGIQELLNKGLIRPVAVHGKSKVYTRAIVKEEEPTDAKAGTIFLSPSSLRCISDRLCTAGAAKAAAKAKKPAAKAAAKEAAAEKPAAEAPKTEA